MMAVEALQSDGTMQVKGQFQDKPVIANLAQVLTCTAGDIHINTDVRYNLAVQRGYTSVRPKVCEPQVDDVQAGCARRDIEIRCGNNHPFRAPKRTSILEPGECQLIRGNGLHLTGDFDLPANLNVIIIVVRIRGNPKTPLFQR